MCVCVHMRVCIYIYIYIYIHASRDPLMPWVWHIRLDSLPRYMRRWGAPERPRVASTSCSLSMGHCCGDGIGIMVRACLMPLSLS